MTQLALCLSVDDAFVIPSPAQINVNGAVGTVGQLLCSLLAGGSPVSTLVQNLLGLVGGLLGGVGGGAGGLGGLLGGLTGAAAAGGLPSGLPAAPSPSAELDAITGLLNNPGA